MIAGCHRALRRAGLLAGTALAIVSLPGPLHGQRFSSSSDVVRVDVLATDAGNPILGLTPADFEVLDNGVLQQVDLVTFDQIPLNIVLALDMSGSVSGARRVQLQSAGRAIVDALKPEDRAALLTFGLAVSLQSGMTGDTAKLRAALEQTRGAGNTSLIDAGYSAIALGDAGTGRSLAIIFSDGEDTASTLTASAVLNTAKRTNTVVYAVSAGGDPRTNFLRELCETTGGRWLSADSTRNLNETFLTVFNEFRHRYLLSYTPRGVSASGWHRLEVRIKGRRATVNARPGYQAG